MLILILNSNYSNCETCGNLTEEECLVFSDEISKNEIDPKKWEMLSFLLDEEWANETGCSVIIYHSETYQEAKNLNNNYHLKFKHNITKWGEKSYILTKWYGSTEN